jgi:RNA polymerase sigma factor (sigma-70 family)
MELVNYTTPEDTKAYRVKITVKNNLLLTAIEQVGYKSVAEFSRDIGLTAQEISSFVALRKAPINQDGEFCPNAKKIMEALGAAPSDLWTTEQLNMKLKRNTTQDLFSAPTIQAILGGNVAQLEGSVYEESEKPEEVLNKKELKAELEKVLGTLTPREAKVLQLRFGLDGCEEHTLGEVGDMLNIGKERVRQIEAKALRNMRHPSRSTIFREYADDLMSADTYKPVWMTEELEDEDSRDD